MRDLFTRLVTQAQGKLPAARPLIPSRYEQQDQRPREETAADEGGSSQEMAPTIAFGEQAQRRYEAMPMGDERIGAAPTGDVSVAPDGKRAVVLSEPLLLPVETRRVAETLATEVVRQTQKREEVSANGADYAREVRHPITPDTVGVPFEMFSRRAAPAFPQDAMEDARRRTAPGECLEPGDPQPPVQVRIGRIEVRLARPDQVPRREGRPRQVKGNSLEEYLKKRSGGRS